MGVVREFFRFIFPFVTLSLTGHGRFSYSLFAVIPLRLKINFIKQNVMHRLKIALEYAGK